MNTIKRKQPHRRNRFLPPATWAVSFILAACDISPQDKPEAKENEVSIKRPEIKLNETKVAFFTNLERKAVEAFQSDELVRCKQLIHQGLNETQRAGREYEIYEARFSLLRGKLAQKQGRSTDARRFLGDAMAVFRIRKNAQGTFEVHLAQSTIEENAGDFAAAQREIDEAQKLLPKIDDPQLKGAFIMNQASLLVRQMKHVEAAKLFLEAAQHFHSIDAKLQEADAFVLLASCEEAIDKAREAQNSLEKAYKIYTAENSKEGAVKALHKLALFSLREERYKKAKEQLQKVESLYLELDRPSDATKVNQHLSALPE
ncbi:MAG: hypothetical protein JXX29_16035 [Deltaproteobacteria bacterium]|nr:hypothetical protein [Deltaproteobacteria bacterium]MBN2673192.1 hypothetical protein [Deltaproteobacteria bacterium]